MYVEIAPRIISVRFPLCVGILRGGQGTFFAMPLPYPSHLTTAPRCEV